MSKFTFLSDAEMERRRLASVEEMKRREREAWDLEYQEKCDTLYWSFGPCCAGCDHWSSHAGMTGECYAGPPVSGEQVLRSMGISWSSYLPSPGQIITRAKHVCEKFKDDFDWSTLDSDYLKRIGAKID